MERDSEVLVGFSIKSIETDDVCQDMDGDMTVHINKMSHFRDGGR